MMYRFRSLALAALLCSTSTAVAELYLSPFGAVFQPNNKNWQSVDSAMSAKEYRNSSRQNLRLARKSARKLILRATSSMGIPEQGAVLTGAALGLVMEGAKFNLNESKTMALELDEVASEDPAISLKFRLEW